MGRKNIFFRKGKSGLRRIVRSFSQFFSLTSLLRKYPALPDEVFKAEREYYKETVKQGMIVFDVGANVGVIANLFSELVGEDGEVHCFEPSENTFQQLKKNCNKMDVSNIILNRVAISNQPGIVKLNVYDDEFSSWNTLANRPLHEYGIHIKPSSIEKVDATTIDIYCQQNNIEYIDLLKIDVEGAEYQALLGAERMLREKAVRNCIFEVGQTTVDMGNELCLLEGYLVDVGYKLSNVVRGEPIMFDEGSTNEVIFSMYIARP